MPLSDEEKVEGRIHGEQPDPGEKDQIMLRLVYMVIIWLMLSLAQSVLTFATIVQFVIMLINGGAANKRLGDFGTDLGIWMAKAARYQTGASEVKPWPWTELD